MPVFPRACSLVLGLGLFATPAFTEPLSRRTEIDFFRDVPSRNLKGLAARSDGRLVAGPTLADLAGDAPADLLWSLAPGAKAVQWFVGSGPDGKIFEITIDPSNSTFASREVVKLDDPHVYALAHLPDGALLAGTSPRGGLALVRNGQQVARVSLPVDSIFDILILPAATASNSKLQTPNSKQSSPHALLATGNPARIYSVDLAVFEKAGVVAEKLTDAALLAEHGIRLFGEVRDRNIRRLARLSDGRIAAGSSPKGNIYAFDAAGGAPVILQENREAEVTDLLPAPDGGLYATLTFSGGTGEGRITPSKTNKDTPDPLAAVQFGSERFGGRSTLVSLPANGFPDTLTSRNNTALYRIARHGDVLLLTGGEQGEVIGYDIPQRLSLTYAGSASSQLNGLAAVPGHSGRFLVMRNNAPGFSLLDFSGTASREAETRRLDLGVPSQFGAVRFNRLRDLADDHVSVALKTSNGSDEVEGWSSWIPLRATDGGWSAPDQRGRYFKLRVTLPEKSPATLQLDKAALFALPQNRRPQLQDFRLLSANFSLIPSPEPMPPTTVSLGQVLQSPKEDDAKSKGSFLGSQIVPSPGTQVVLWTVTDPDNDNVVLTFSIRRDGDETWTDVVVNTTGSYAQFDTAHLPEGLYFTRLVATETDPRLPADRLTTTFETDDLLVDHTPPEIQSATAKRQDNRVVITVQGRDTLSLVQGFEAILNNGVRAETEQPVDGIRDSRQETFVIELPLDRATGATAVEVIFYDAVGNHRAQRLKLE